MYWITFYFYTPLLHKLDNIKNLIKITTCGVSTVCGVKVSANSEKEAFFNICRQINIDPKKELSFDVIAFDKVSPEWKPNLKEELKKLNPARNFNIYTEFNLLR